MPPIQSPKSPLTNNGGASSTPNIIDDLLLTSLFDPPNVIAQHVAGNPNDVQETASSIPPPEPFPPSIYPDFGVGGILVNRDADSIQNPTSNGSSDSFGGSSLAATDASFASSGFPFQLSTFPDYNIGNNSTADMNRPSRVVYAAPPSRRRMRAAKKFECPYCFSNGMKTFGRKADCKRHMKAFHSNSAPLECPLCDYTYPRVDKMTEHMWKKHNDVGFTRPEGRH